MGGIFWLASYPKSGNTWLRVFLANLLNKGEHPIDINKLSINHFASNRRAFDEILGVESSDMTGEEIEGSRPLCYRRLAASSPDSVYIKVHDAYANALTGEPLFPVDATIGAVYLVRNPLDVAVSFAHHMATTIDATIRRMGNPNFSFSAAQKGRLSEQLEQQLLSWSGHVLSWLDQSSIPLHLMRYEDMLRRPLATFNGCLDFLGLSASNSDIERALSRSSFSAMTAQERAYGFRERPQVARTFFRSGTAGGWRSNLTESQVQLILKDHSGVMRRLGYIGDDGSIL